MARIVLTRDSSYYIQIKERKETLKGYRFTARFTNYYMMIYTHERLSSSWWEAFFYGKWLNNIFGYTGIFF